MIRIYERALEAGGRLLASRSPVHFSGGRTAASAALLWDSGVTADVGAQPARGAGGLPRSAGSNPAEAEAGGWGRRTPLCATARKSQCRAAGGGGRGEKRKDARAGSGRNLGAAERPDRALLRHCPPRSGRQTLPGFPGCAPVPRAETAT